MKTHEFRAEGLAGVAHRDVADESADIVRQLHVGRDIHMTT